MVKYIFWTATAWTMKTLLCVCRFFWVNPYHAIADLPRKMCETGTVCDSQVKNATEPESRVRLPRPDRSNILHTRLSKAEGEIQLLKSRLACEKASWDRRLMELQRKQQDLQEQLASETFARASVFLKNEPDYNNGVGENRAAPDVENCSSPEEKDLGAATEPGGERHHLRQQEIFRSVGYHDSLTDSQVSLPSSLWSRPTSAISTNTSSGSSRSVRVFVPHSPLDLRVGHRVRVLLPSGRISTGCLRFVGPLADGQDFSLGVELEYPQNGKRDGDHGGRCYFECEPGHGAFVTFDKLLMVWE